MKDKLKNMGYITVAEAAIITGLKEVTIRNYVNDGTFTKHKVGYAIFLDEEEVINYRNRQGGKSIKKQTEEWNDR